MWVSALIAFALVALAEFGDKSQLLLLAFSARYKPVKVAVGAGLAIGVLQLMAVLAGSAFRAVVPTRIIALGAGALFIAVGVVTWVKVGSGDDEEERATARRLSRFGPVITVALAFLLAEFGDKTQLLTMSIAADPGGALPALGLVATPVQTPAPGMLTSLGVWLGSSIGMLVADLLAIAVGAVLGARLPTHVVGRMSAVVFIVFGMVTMLSGLGVIAG